MHRTHVEDRQASEDEEKAKKPKVTQLCSNTRTTFVVINQINS